MQSGIQSKIMNKVDQVIMALLNLSQSSGK